MWQPLIAQSTASPAPPEMPWWGWALFSILTLVLGTLIPKAIPNFFEYLLNKVKVKGASIVEETKAETEQIKVEGQVKQESRKSEFDEHRGIVEEYRKVVRFQEARIDKLERKAEEQAEEMEEMRRREQDCLLKYERVLADNLRMMERMDSHEDALKRAGIHFRPASRPSTQLPNDKGRVVE